VALAALAAVGFLVWFSVDPLQLYGGGVALIGLGTMVLAMPLALLARRHPLGPIAKGGVHRSFCPGQPVEIVRPGGPICGDLGGPTPLFASVALFGPVIGGVWTGRLAGTIQASRRRRDEEGSSIPAIDFRD